MEDLALALPVLSALDWKDASVVPMPLADWRAVGIGSLRMAIYTHHAGAEPTHETAGTCQQAARVLADRCGRVVEEALPPCIEEAYFITRQYWKRPESASSEEWVPQGDFSLSSEEVAQHLFMWDRFRRALIAFMADYDVILTPAAELPAMLHGENAGRIPYTLPYSLTGYPWVVVRGGTSREGLPIGVQVVARPWRDDVALAVAHELERVLGGWQPPPLD